MKKQLITGLLSLAVATNIFADTKTNQDEYFVSVFDSRVYKDLFSTPEVKRIFSDKNMVQQWLNVEIALAKAQADLGIIPKSAAKAIEDAAKIENMDFDAIRKKTNKVGRGIKPLLGQIKKAGNTEVKQYLHFGSTTQDIMDSATVLQVKQASSEIKKELVNLTLVVATLASKHKGTVMLARSNGQDAIPTTFGLHLTTYLMELYRNVQRLDEATSRLQAQIGSTVGTLAPFYDKGLALQKKFSANLGLKSPLAPWNPSRDNFAEIVQTLGLINATLGRLSLDINNLSRTQIDELKEGEGGASSTMPQKRNPRASEFMGAFYRMAKMYNAASLDIMSHTDARQGSPWILEWSIIPESFMVTAASINRAQRMFAKLIVKEENMIKNFSVSKNYALSEALMNALTKELGRSKAYKLVKTAIKKAHKNDGLAEVINKTPEIKKHLSKKQIEEVLIPSNYIGSAPTIVDRAVAKVRSELK